MANKFFRKKDKWTKITAIFVLLLFIVGYACERELSESSSENEKENAQTIDQAKVWYEANKPVEFGLRSSNGADKLLMKPDWTHAFTNKNEKYKIVETDVSTLGLFRYIDKDCMEKYKETSDIRYKQSYTRLVFRTDRKTNVTVGFLMTFVPNVEWMEKSKFKPFMTGNYLKRCKDFGGAILFHNLDGSFSNGWVYEKGKITGSIGAMEEGQAKISLRSTVCYWVDVYYEWEHCTDWYTVHESGDELNGTTCNYWWEYAYCYEVCEDDGTGSGEYSGDIGGGGGGSNPDTNTPDNPCVSGTSGNANNNSMLSNSTISNSMDILLKNYAKDSVDEWAVSIGQNTDGTYYVTPAKDCGINGHTTIPDLPNGMPLVSYGHSHGQYGIGVPSPGDLYGFLGLIAGNPSLNSMYVYGTGWDTPETYAINVNDRGAVAAFLAKYPQSANMSSLGDFILGSDIYKHYENAMKAYNSGNYNYQAGAHPYIPEALALSYIMSYFNMGVSLTRKVDNDSFKIINTQNVNGTYNITTCQ